MKTVWLQFSVLFECPNPVHEEYYSIMQYAVCFILNTTSKATRHGLWLVIYAFIFISMGFFMTVVIIPLITFKASSNKVSLNVVLQTVHWPKATTTTGSNATECNRSFFSRLCKKETRFESGVQNFPQAPNTTTTKGTLDLTPWFASLRTSGTS